MQLFFYRTKKRVGKERDLERDGGREKRRGLKRLCIIQFEWPERANKSAPATLGLVRYKCQRSNSSLSTRLNIQKLINFCCTGVIKAERGGGSIERNLFQAIDIGKWHLYLLDIYGVKRVWRDAERWTSGTAAAVSMNPSSHTHTHMLALTRHSHHGCLNPHSPPPSHRIVSSRWQSQGFSTYKHFFSNNLPKCFL